jgi:hypothetical protein
MQCSWQIGLDQLFSEALKLRLLSVPVNEKRVKIKDMWLPPGQSLNMDSGVADTTWNIIHFIRGPQ